MPAPLLGRADKFDILQEQLIGQRAGADVAACGAILEELKNLGIDVKRTICRTAGAVEKALLRLRSVGRAGLDVRGIDLVIAHGLNGRELGASWARSAAELAHSVLVRFT